MSEVNENKIEEKKEIASPTIKEEKTDLKSSSKHFKPAYLKCMSEAERLENYKIIENMNRRIKFPINPRYKNKAKPIKTTEVI